MFLIFDLLTLNIMCHVIKLCTNLSEIEQFAADLLRFIELESIRHLRFDRKWTFTILRPPSTHNILACQSSTQSSTARLSY